MNDDEGDDKNDSKDTHPVGAHRWDKELINLDNEPVYICRKQRVLSAAQDTLSRLGDIKPYLFPT